MVRQKQSVKYVCDLSEIKQARGWGKCSDEFSLFYKTLLFRDGDEHLWACMSPAVKSSAKADKWKLENIEIMLHIKSSLIIITQPVMSLTHAMLTIPSIVAVITDTAILRVSHVIALAHPAVRYIWTCTGKTGCKQRQRCSIRQTAKRILIDRQIHRFKERLIRDG